MKLSIMLEGRYFSAHACIEIEELFLKCFSPVETGDFALISSFNNEVSSAEAKVIMKTREDAAEIIAKEISEFIVSQMKSRDTHNGYAKDE